jgi:hypothetical protein
MAGLLSPSATVSVATFYEQLRAAGFELRVAESGRLQIAPADRVTPDLLARLKVAKAALVSLVCSSDAAVLERVESFRQQLIAAPSRSVPAFIFQSGVPYVPGRCFSCGDCLPEMRFGRCWRCAFAWRLAVGVPVAAESARASDEARSA